jgi:hypothetical protein
MRNVVRIAVTVDIQGWKLLRQKRSLELRRNYCNGSFKGLESADYDLTLVEANESLVRDSADAVHRPIASRSALGLRGANHPQH